MDVTVFPSPEVVGVVARNHDHLSPALALEQVERKFGADWAAPFV